MELGEFEKEPLRESGNRMNILVHDINGTKIAEMQSTGIIIRSARDADDIVEQLLQRPITRLILHERNLCPEFWQLSSGLAGDILQKFTNHGIAVAFVGDFEKNKSKSKSLSAFIHESNLHSQFIFTDSIESAQMRLRSE